MTDRTLPTNIRTRATWAIGHLEAWNAAVLQARAMEKIAGQPGRYEFDLRAGKEQEPLRALRHQATQALDALELTVRKRGWSLDAFYAALELERPVLLPEGPHVVDWFQGCR